MKRVIAAMVAAPAAMVIVAPAAPASPFSPSGQEISINEATTRGFFGSQNEYIEFQNLTGDTLDLTAYRLRFTEPGEQPVEFASWPEGASVEAGQLFLFMGEDYAGPMCGGLLGAFDLPDSGRVSLHRPNGELVDSITVPQVPPPPQTPCE